MESSHIKHIGILIVILVLISITIVPVFLGFNYEELHANMRDVFVMKNWHFILIVILLWRLK